MDQHEKALCQYLEIALDSHKQRQMSGRDKLLVLAGAAACRAGLIDVADQCRGLIIANNPQHFLCGFARFFEALQDDEGQTLVKQIQRQIPLEQAEYLLSGNADDSGHPEESESTEQFLLRVQELLHEISEAV